VLAIICSLKNREEEPVSAYNSREKNSDSSGLHVTVPDAARIAWQWQAIACPL
jgi:hypothetical protein